MNVLKIAAKGAQAAKAWDLDFASFSGITPGKNAVTYAPAIADVKLNSNGTRLYILDNTRDMVFQQTLETPYQPNTAEFTSKNVATQDTIPYGIEFKPDGTKLYMVGTDSDNINQYDLSTAWDITTATFIQSFSVSSQGTAPYKIRFKDDGTKAYILNIDTVYQYSLSSAWDISTASYDSVSFSASSQDTAPQGLFFGDSGAKMYIVGVTNDTVYQYTLSTPWDLSTALYASLSFSVASQDTNPRDVFFKSDGTIMYVYGDTGDDINQYALSTAWNVSTASYTKVSSPSFVTLLGATTARGMYIKSDGTLLYIVDSSTDLVYQLSMSTAWDVATLAPGIYVGGSPQAITFKNDGTKMYVVDNAATSVYQYSLSSAWNVLTASYDSVSYNVSTQESAPLGIAFKDDGTKMYIIGSSGDDVNEYDLSTAWNVSTASYVQNFSVFSEAGGAPYKVEFKSDGTKMYVLSDTNDAIYEYGLSSAWDISTASYSSVSVLVNTFTSEASLRGLAFADSGKKVYIAGIGLDRVDGFVLGTAWDLSTANAYSRYVGALETAPNSVTFKPDGTEMYILGAGGDDVNQFSVSSAWSAYTASYVRVFLVSTQAGATPVKVQFKDDGTKMYVLSRTNDAIYQYSLSTAWDISTATYDTVSFSVSTQESDPIGMFFGDAGSKLYVVGGANDTVYQYTLSSAWDLSTASYASLSFNVSSQETTPAAVFLGDSGSKMYIVGQGNDTVYQYDLTTPWDVSTASYANKSFNIYAYEITPAGLWFKDDGTSFYITGNDNDKVWEFTIS
jgi:DNA-binding beta-propeller fold protein YncE